MAKEATVRLIRLYLTRAAQKGQTAAAAFKGLVAASAMTPAQIQALGPVFEREVAAWNKVNPGKPIMGGADTPEAGAAPQAPAKKAKTKAPSKIKAPRTPEVAARAAAPAAKAAAGGSLGAMSWAKLVSMAKKKGIADAGKMTKPQLVAALAGKPAAKVVAAAATRAPKPAAAPAGEAAGKAAAERFGAAVRGTKYRPEPSRGPGRMGTYERAQRMGRPVAEGAAKETVARAGTMRGGVVGPGAPLGKGVFGLTRKHAARRALKGLATKGAKAPKVPKGAIHQILRMLGPYLLFKQFMDIAVGGPGQEKLAGMQLEAQAAGQPSAEDIVQQAMLQDITAQRQTQLGGPGGMNPEMMQAIQAQQMMQQRQMQMQKLQQQLTQNEIMLPGPGMQQQAPMMGGAGPVGPGGITPQRIFGLA